MKNLILLIAALSFFISTSIFAQHDRSYSEKQPFHKNITLELAGSHLALGLNYDMRLQRGRNDGFGFKVGVGGWQNFTIDDFGLITELLTVPIEFNHIIGKKRHGLVTGLGLLTGYTNEKYGFDDDDPDVKSIGAISAYAIVGYRFQPLNSGFTFELNFNPHIFLNDIGVFPYVGMSLGYGFK